MEKTLLFTCLILLLILIPMSTDAASQKFTITIPQGTGLPGCQETNECYIPYEIRVDVGTTVTWSIDDTSPHTVTSGTAADGPDGVFGSSLFRAGATFEHTFDVAGEYPYFCMVRPWMTGIVIVQEAMAEEESLVKIETGVGNAGEPLEITVTIGESDGTTQDVHANFNIMATQGNEVVLDETVHSMSGMEMLTTNALPMDASSTMPVNVNVEFLGFGTNEPFTGTPETGDIQVVPEFGTIAMMVLGVSIISIIALSAKSRVIPKL